MLWPFVCGRRCCVECPAAGWSSSFRPGPIQDFRITTGGGSSNTVLPGIASPLLEGALTSSTFGGWARWIWPWTHTRFNGCVTTLEGLWMGVPIVTLTGPTYVAQVGLDILSRLGLEFFVARTPDEYVAKACAAASQLEPLASIRGRLRGMMLDSPLCDPNRFTHELEQVFSRYGGRGVKIRNQESGVRSQNGGGRRYPWQRITHNSPLERAGCIPSWSKKGDSPSPLRRSRSAY